MERVNKNTNMRKYAVARDEDDGLCNVSPDTLRAKYIEAKAAHELACGNVVAAEAGLRHAKAIENDAVLMFLRIEGALKKRRIPYESLSLYRRGV